SFFFSSRRRHTRFSRDWSSDVCSSDLDEIQKTMMEECDFIKEANNLKVFREFLQNTHNEDATVPRVYEHCSTRRILTMERFHGRSEERRVGKECGSRW